MFAMGAERPQLQKKSSQTLLPSVLIAAAALLFVMVALQEIGTPKNNDPGTLNPKEAARLEKRLREIDDSEQYALVAGINGWYPCLHSGRSTFYLKSGEVWKYGVTSKGEFGRYTATFLIKNKVSYIVEFKGTFSECLKQEQIKLFGYPYLPENVARPETERLSRPPYNPIMR